MQSTAFIRSFEQQWPLPFAVADAVLVSCHFNADQLSPEDFSRLGIEPVAGRTKRQSEYLAGRLCAREALQQVTGIARFPERQKDGSPQWPEGVTGSITHSHGRAAAIVASQTRTASVGIDAEQILEPARAQRLMSEILTEREQLDSHHMNAEELARLVTLTFSVKESLYKALFPLVHKQFYFRHAEVIEINPDGRARLQLLTDLSPSWREGSIIHGQFTYRDDQILTLVTIPAEG